jgi:hypothetical protein
VPQRDFRLEVASWLLPARTRHLVLVAKIPKLHHVTNPHSLVAVVVVVALPDSPKTIDRHLPIVSKVPAERFHM